MHEQRKAEADLQSAGETDGEAPVAKKRRGGEYGLDWKCQTNGCEKDYKSVIFILHSPSFSLLTLCYLQKRALQIHINVEHKGRRDFSCTREDCTYSFGYNHLLQRHVAKMHSSEIDHWTSSEEPDTDREDAPNEGKDDFNIDLITGNLYAKQAEANLKTATVLRCPYPELDGLLDPLELDAQRSMPESSTTPLLCLYVFSRAYDLRRHLGSAHNVVLSKEVVDRWTKRMKTIRDRRAILVASGGLDKGG